MCDCRRAQVSHPQSSRLAGMARKICFFALRSAYGFFQKWRRAPMAWLAFVMRFLMSMSSVRSKEMYDPRYLKWAVKSMNDSLSSRSILFVISDCQYRFSRCFMVMVQKVSGLVRCLGCVRMDSCCVGSSSNSSVVSMVGSSLVVDNWSAWAALSSWFVCVAVFV